MSAVPIGGFVEPGFEAVAQAFTANLDEHGDVGAAVCVHHHGHPVVDPWGGLADRDANRPWERDTLQLVFSTTKGLAATCVHLLVERGVLDLDAAVARYWPEFAAEGKADIPLRWVLSHEAGFRSTQGRRTDVRIAPGSKVTEGDRPLVDAGQFGSRMSRRPLPL